MEYVSIAGNWVEKIKHRARKEKEIKKDKDRKDMLKKVIVKKNKNIKANINKKKGE